MDSIVERPKYSWDSSLTRLEECYRMTRCGLSPPRSSNVHAFEFYLTRGNAFKILGLQATGWQPSSKLFCDPINSGETICLQFNLPFGRFLARRHLEGLTDILIDNSVLPRLWRSALHEIKIIQASHLIMKRKLNIQIAVSSTGRSWPILPMRVPNPGCTRSLEVSHYYLGSG